MTYRPTLAIHTLGCKLNQAESEKLAQKLSLAGYVLTLGRSAEVHVLNTCTVTHVADSKSRHMVRMLRRRNPQSYIVVTGCYAENAEQDLIDCGADSVIANRDKMSLPDTIAAEIKGSLGGGQGCDNTPATGKVRSFIKIQDGCTNFCAYCIVPYVRSKFFSVDVDKVIAEIREKVAAGYAEIVLTGTEIGAYSMNSLKLSGLVQRILSETDIHRLHLSSLQPQGINTQLLNLWKDGRLSRHFHVALQSGSDSVLQRMRRCYDTAKFKRTMDRILDIIPDASVTTDVMVGFPGESDAEFLESYNFCKNARFAGMHVFVYSVRPGTLAAQMPDKVGEKLKKERSLKMLQLAAHSADKFAERFIGEARKILWENEIRRGSSIYTGFTDNYVRTYAKSEEDLTNKIIKTRLLSRARDLKELSLRTSARGNHGELWGEVLG
ncbi:MAG: tRNA (N(6)-L-threonylcarbamoyladenosine(37)-C(2))-methylthiotransferase MtaB [Dehalococcoidia bacterium]